MGAEEAGRPGAFEALRRFGATVLAVLRNRLELLVVELQEERLRLLKALVWVAVAAALACFTLTMAALGVVIVVWDHYGVEGVFALSGLGLAATALAFWRLRARWKNWPLLSATLAELKKDFECLAGGK